MGLFEYLMEKGTNAIQAYLDNNEFIEPDLMYEDFKEGFANSYTHWWDTDLQLDMEAIDQLLITNVKFCSDYGVNTQPRDADYLLTNYGYYYVFDGLLDEIWTDAVEERINNRQV
jgi:hypothetical protein